MALEGVPKGAVVLWDPVNNVPYVVGSIGGGGGGGISDGVGDAPWNGVTANPSLLAVMKAIYIQGTSTAAVPVLITGQPIQTTSTGGGTTTLSALTLSSTSATAGTAFSATINNRTAGSTITATSSDGTTLSVSGTTVSGTFSAAGSPNISLVETLAGATGSPKTTVIGATVAAASGVPNAPTSLTVIGQTATTVSLSWTAPTGPAVLDYAVAYRITGSGSGFTSVDTISTATSFTLTGLTAATSYDIEVFASNGSGASPASNIATATTSASGASTFFTTMFFPPLAA